MGIEESRLLMIPRLLTGRAHLPPSAHSRGPDLTYYKVRYTRGVSGVCIRLSRVVVDCSLLLSEQIPICVRLVSLPPCEHLLPVGKRLRMVHLAKSVYHTSDWTEKENEHHQAPDLPGRDKGDGTRSLLLRFLMFLLTFTTFDAILS